MVTKSVFHLRSQNNHIFLPKVFPPRPMSASLYIVIEGIDPGFDTFVNGRALAQYEDDLDRLAAELKARPLLDFFSADANSMALLEEEGYKLPHAAESLPPPQWYSAEDGLNTISTLIEYLELNPTFLGEDNVAIRKELEEYITVLEKATAKNLRWHLAVSWR
jgi:hypothetical protein